VMFAPDCVALAATVSARGRYSGGFAFTWHPGLEHTAIYPAARIADYRALGISALLSVLLHEEFHLATALASTGDAFEEVGAATFEAGAEIVQHTVSMIVTGYLPTQPELRDYLEEIGEQRLCRLIGLLADDGAADVAALIRRVAALAVAAPAGDRALAKAVGVPRFSELGSVLGVGGR
jgi:hypothetical protein